MNKPLIRLRIYLLFVSPLLLLFAMAAVLPYLQDGPPSFTSLDAILVWVFMGGGGLYLAGKIMAFLVENWAGWHTLPHGVKVVFPIFLAGILGVISESVLALELIEFVPAPLTMAILAIVNYYGSQKAYIEIKDQGDDGYGASARALAMDG